MTAIKFDYETAVQEAREAIGDPVSGETITEMIQDLKRQYELAYHDALNDIKNAGMLAVNIVQEIEPTDGNYDQLNTVIKKLKKAFGLESVLSSEDFVL